MYINHLEEVAAKAGKTIRDIRENNVIDDATLEKFQNGDESVELSTLHKLCKYLECEPDDIVEFVFEEGQV